MQKQKANYLPLAFTAFLALVAAAGLYYFTAAEAPQTEPKITLSYFKDNAEFAETIEKALQPEIVQQNYFWIGYEPENEIQFELSLLIKQEIEKKNGPFDIVILDKELMLAEEKEKALKITHEIALKENFTDVGDLIKANKDKKILVITAAIYSTNLIQANPHGKIKELIQLKPFVFSLGFLPVNSNDERKTPFKCDTEDKTGTAPWACAVVNKARTIRRRIDLEKLKAMPAPRMGLMDLTGDLDYMVLVKK